MLEYSKPPFLITADRSKRSLDTICSFLSRSHWAANRKRSTIAKSIENSLCYCVLFGNRQVAFARVVTDYATYAYLCDVFVDEEFRGQGLSKWMMECVMKHPDLPSLRHGSYIGTIVYFKQRGSYQSLEKELPTGEF